jgi:hypothetical protein
LVYSAFVAILGVGCDGVCPPCTKLESEVLSAVVSGDTLVLAEYLEGSSTYDFHCREHVDALREGERLSRMVQYTKHTPILRTYLRYQERHAVGHQRSCDIRRNERDKDAAGP